VANTIREWAKTKLMAYGYPLRDVRPVVKLRACDEKRDGMWVWRSGGAWIGGSYDRMTNTLVIGTDAKTMTEFSGDVLLHEMGHALGPANHPAGMETLFGFHD
jgi:hypothetical protein